MLKAFQACFTMGLFLSCRREEADPAAEQDSRPGKYRAILMEKLSGAEQQLIPHWGTEASRAARRMVTVWLDEILIEAPWPGRQEWLYRPLQSEWGEGRNGGLWFFQNLESLRPDRRDGRELAALALRCISLGLCGCYGRNMEGLNQVRQKLQEDFGFKDHSPIFPPPLPPGGPPKGSPGLLAIKLLAAVFAVLSLVGLAGAFSLEQKLHTISMESEGV